MARTKRVRRRSIASFGRASSASIDSDAVEDGHYDASHNEAITGNASAQDRRYWPYPGAGSFIRSGAGLEGRWVGVRPLGAGSFGLTGLWQRRSGDGRVVDYIAVKQTKGDTKNWSPEVPEEVRIMKKMNKTHCRAVVRLRAYRRRYFPEAFLWEVLYYLMEAALAMESGPVNTTWGFQIAHRDIKPENIFLGSPYTDEDGIPFYPTPKLGDFGIARECYTTDPDNPSDMLEGGTKGWQAPEQIQSFYDIRKTYLQNPFINYGHTNVWAIGAVMYELLTLRKVGSIWLRGVRDLHHGINPIVTGKRPEYSRALKDIVRDCLRPYPRERPTAYPTLNEIDTHRRLILNRLAEQPGNRNIPIGGERLYYRGSEINDMPAGNWQPSPDDEEKDPDDPEDAWYDPDVSPIKFPRFKRKALTEENPQSREKRTPKREAIARENERASQRHIDLRDVYNLWHQREYNEEGVEAEDVVEEREEDENPSNQTRSDSESDDAASEHEDAEGEDGDDDEYRDVGRSPTSTSFGDLNRSVKEDKGNKGLRRSPRNNKADLRLEEEEDQPPTKHLRRHRGPNDPPPLKINSPPSSKGKRKADQNEPLGIEAAEEEDQSPTQNNKRRRRRLEEHPKPPESPPDSPLSSIGSSQFRDDHDDAQKLGIGPEEGGLAEHEETEDETEGVRKNDENHGDEAEAGEGEEEKENGEVDGPHDDSLDETDQNNDNAKEAGAGGDIITNNIINNEDDDHQPTIAKSKAEAERKVKGDRTAKVKAEAKGKGKAKAKPRRATNTASQSYQAPGKKTGKRGGVRKR